MMAEYGVLRHPWLLIFCFVLTWHFSEQFLPPYFTNVPMGTTVQIREDAKPGAFVYAVKARDAEGDKLTFSVIGGDAFFTFDQASAKRDLSNLPFVETTINLVVKGAQPGLDFETRKEHDVTIRVTDDLFSITSVLRVKLLNANDNSPTLIVVPADLTIEEETPAGVGLGYSVTFSDADVGDAVYVGFLGGAPEFLSINPSTGLISLNSVVDIDPNTEFKVYNPVIYATDRTFTTTLTLTLTIRDINDNPPICNPSTVSGDVTEQQPGGAVVCRFTCTDRDSSYNNNNKLSFTILQGNSSLFSVSDTGAVTVLTSLDYEEKKSHSLVVRVRDGGIFQTTATASITVKPINDIIPVWGPWKPPYPQDMTYSVFENATQGTSILTVFATDADVDLGNEIAYSMAVTVTGGGPQLDVFSLDPVTGVLTTRSTLERDGPNGVEQYTITVQASDGPVNTHMINRTVYLNVADVNDNAPRFLGTPYPVVVLQEEASRAGAVVTRVSAADDDLSSTVLTFSVAAVISGNTLPNDWRFSQTVPGQLELASTLDLDIDNPPSVVSVLRLIVKDNGFPELTGTASLTVSLVPDNQYSPTIVSQPGSVPVQVPENTPVGSQVARIEAGDQDKGPEGVLVYAITAGNTALTFSIDSRGGIRTEKVLDNEAMNRYVLTILISDSGINIIRSVTTTMTIEVTDVNDNSPTCQYTAFAIPENSAVNTTVATLLCNDSDAGDILTLSVRPPLNSIFGFITPSKPPRSTWELKLLKEVDYDSSNQSYAVDIVVSDGSNSLPLRPVVNLIAVNEATPTFQTNPTVTVPENAIQNPIIVYEATDTDYSPHNVVSYKIDSVSNGGAALFNMDSSSGTLFLLKELDYESLPAGDKTYRIVVVAEDGGGLKGTGTVTVSVGDVSDNFAICKNSVVSIHISEKQNAPYTVLPSLNCSDQQSGRGLTYSLSQTPGDHFSVVNGSIVLKDSLDFEKASSHTLTVEVKDSGIPAQTFTVTVYVIVDNENDGPPVFNPTVPASVSETAPIGEFVADVTAVDPDGDDPQFGAVQYSIIDGDTQLQFFIDGQTGRLITRKKLDFETISSYRLVIQAKEKGGANSATVTQIVNVIDAIDETLQCPSSFRETVRESEPIDFTVSDLKCRVADAGVTLTYRIVSGNTTLFKMDGNLLKLRSQLDYEEMPVSHDLIILVSDSVPSHDVNISGTVVTGSVDEGPPTFDQDTYTVHVLENETINSVVFILKAVDPDSSRDPNGQVKYSFLASYPLFALDQLTGEIFLANTLDREIEAVHTLMTKAEDASGSDTATVSVVVDDVNDNGPVFPPLYRGRVSELAPVGTSVLTVKATDADDPNFKSYGKVRYQLFGSSDFKIDASSGIISTAAPLNVGNKPRSYTLTVNATDSDGAAGALSSVTTVNIQITTTNLYAPEFTQPTYRVTVQENQFSADDIIISVVAKDDDLGPNGELTLTLLAAEDNFYLTQSGKTGEIRLIQDLDFDSGDTAFAFDVVATDKGSPPLSGSCAVVVTVDDVNDNPPLCPRYIVLDKVEGETNLIKIPCSDIDQTSILSYSIISTSPSSIQPTISRDGLMTVSTPLDYEMSPRYQVIVQVSDNGVPATNITVTLRVKNVNDNDPAIVEPLAFDLLENATSDVGVVYTVRATGGDGPTEKITYTLSDNPYFDITADTGEMRLKGAAPDYERIGGFYRVEVCVTDTPNPTARTTCKNVNVTIVDCNDEKPQFYPLTYQATVGEDADLGRSVVTVSAVDKDASARYNTITYSIQEGNVDGCFRILPSGVIELIKKLDYEKIQSYSLTIAASDGLYSATALCSITVSAVNEFTPTFADNAVTVNVEENALINTFVFTAVATDSDAGNDGLIVYSIDPGPFAIDSLSGNVTVVGSLDRETTASYNLAVRAVDQGASPKTGTLLLTINVDDVNDHAPDCGRSSFAVSVRESVSSEDILIALNCVDDDDDPAGLNNALSYSISSANSNLFIVDQSGQVKLRPGAALDRETVSFYNITVAISDRSTRLKKTTVITIGLTVLDVNDNDPFIISMVSPSVPEDTLPGTTIASIRADDKDEGTNKLLTYQIVSGNEDNTFSLDASSGDLVLRRPLDFETKQSYFLGINIRDRGSPSRSVFGTLTVNVTDVNDGPPVCSTPMYTATVKENSVNEDVVSVYCSDKDGAGSVKYSITDGNDGNFVIDANTGAIKTGPTARLDFETVEAYVLEITASDGTFSDTTFVRITVVDVNEFPPRFTPPGPVNVTIREDASVNSVVYIFVATDQDTADVVRIFSIVSGNSAGKFVLGPQTGRLQLQNTLDYESQTSYVLTVMVEDSGRRNDTIILYVNVIDVNDNTPICTNNSVTITVAEGTTISSLYTPSCSDADKVASPVLEYSLQADAPSSFSISSATGQLSLVQPLDFETESVIFLKILVREQNVALPKDTSVNVRIVVNPVNEFAPVFEPASNYGPYEIPEDTVPGTVVAQVSASDADKGASDFVVRYAITSGDPQGYLYIDETNGDIRTLRQLTREIFSEYTLTVTATDSVPGAATAKSAAATVKLIITDVNDYRPQLVPSLYTLNVSETAQFGPTAVIVRLIIEDKDEGDNKATTVTIVSGNNENKFRISGHDLILINPLDYETTTFYELVLEISDSGKPPLKSSGRVRIRVLPVNEASPRMKEFSAEVSIPENSPLGMLVYDADATDTDNEVDGQITYSIDRSNQISGNSQNEFVINPTTGQLFVNAPLDFDILPNTYSLVIRATDGAGASDPVTSAVTLRITLTDVNDNGPKFTSPVVNMTVLENVALRTQVGVVQATDADSGRNGQVSYNLTGGSGYTYFTVDSTSGAVATAGNIDYEMFQTFYLTVMAVDGGTPSRTADCLIKVDVSNVNDNSPVISPQDFLVNVSENAEVGDTVLAYTASDLDTAISRFSFVIASQYFEVDPKTGNVRVKSKLDKDRVKVHTLYVQVEDMATPADPTVRTSTATLVIQIDVRNNYDPVIFGTYETSVPEDVSVDYNIFRINATDADSNQADMLTYFIIAGNIDDVFRIDSQGYVKLAKSLDRETVSSYTLTIQVRDPGIPPRLAETDAQVTVTDINDNDPIFTQRNYTFAVAEMTSMGTSVGSVQATDADSGVNAELTYVFDSFLAGNGSHFSLHPLKGIITVATADLDKERIPSYVAVVMVSDSGSPKRSSFAQVTFSIKDETDLSPVFSQATYTATLNEESEPGTRIIQVSAIDDDAGPDAELSYFIDTKSLDGPTAKTYLQVDETSGIIYSTNRVSYEDYQLFRIVVTAADKGIPSLTGTTTVIVTIIDINDNSAVFGPSFYNSEVAYHGECNNYITTVNATDKDSGKNGELSYYLQTTAFQNFFEVSPSSGDLTIKNIVRPYAIYKLEINAIDGGEPTRTSAKPAKVRVDTFVPNDVVVTFRLGVSRKVFLAELDEFIKNVERVIHTKYPTAIGRVWCIVEYEGVAVLLKDSRRRLLADMPVDVHTYALRNNLTDSEEYINQGKDFIMQDELLAFFAANPEGDPNNNVEGGQWEYLNVTTVKPYYQRQSSWLDEDDDGKIIMAIAASIAFILLCLMMCILVKCCHSWLGVRRKHKHLDSVYSSKMDSELSKSGYLPEVEMLELPMKTLLYSDVKTSTVSLLDSDPYVTITPSKKGQPKGQNTDDFDKSPDNKNKASSSESDSGFYYRFSSPRASDIKSNESQF